MHGDFDVTLRFDDLQMPDLYSAAGLGLYIGDNGSEAEFKFLAAEGVSAIFSWNPDGRHVLMSRAGLLHEYDIETGQIAPMPGHSADPAKDGAVWDTAGRRIVFINRLGKRIDITINAIQSKPQRLAAA